MKTVRLNKKIKVSVFYIIFFLISSIVLPVLSLLIINSSHVKSSLHFVANCSKFKNEIYYYIIKC